MLALALDKDKLWKKFTQLLSKVIMEKVICNTLHMSEQPVQMLRFLVVGGFLCPAVRRTHLPAT